MREDESRPQTTRPAVGIDAESVRAESLRIEIESLQAQLVELSARQAKALADLEASSPAEDTQSAAPNGAPGLPPP
jgi:hypothetical protein